MTAKHTQGLLAINPIQPNQIATADASSEIARATIRNDHRETIGNARRIVACWNACDGISTENLEDNQSIKDLAANYNAVIHQRDELLNFLKHMAGTRLVGMALEEANALIAKATGATCT